MTSSKGSFLQEKQTYWTPLSPTYTPRHLFLELGFPQTLHSTLSIYILSPNARAHELNVNECEVVFVDFKEIAQDPLKIAQGYNPDYRAHSDATKKIIEFNTASFQNSDFSHWRNWDNIIAHEVGHLILNTPMVMTRMSDNYIGHALARYQFELYNIAQDLTIPHHILPKKYTDYDYTKIVPWKRYSRALRKVRDVESRFKLKLALIEKFPLYYGYGHYCSGEENKRILREENQILIQEPILKTIASDTERLVKPYTRGKDSRDTDLQRLVDQGFENLRFWLASQGKW